MGEEDIIQCNCKVKPSALKSKVVSVALSVKGKRLQTRSRETCCTGICIAVTEGVSASPADLLLPKAEH